MNRPPVAFIAWTFVTGRAAEVADALGGEALTIFYRRLRCRQLVPLRYLLSAVRTISYLARRRPRSVIVTLPPVFPGLISWGYCRLARAPLVLDSHPSGFGRKDDRVSERLLPLHRWLSRRVSATMVTTGEWADVVDYWGGRGIVVHEAPARWKVRPPAPARVPLEVLFVCVFSPDEPVEEVIEAARTYADVRITITGDLRRVSPHILSTAPGNVVFSGYLDEGRYREALERADVVLALTTEPTSVMRAAYEAVYAQKPLVASDHPATRGLFEHAVLVKNEAASIREGLHQAASSHAQLLEVAPAARLRQQERWNDQLCLLRRVLSMDLEQE